MKTARYLALCLSTLAGCNSGTMSVDSYNARTGQSSHTVYSKYYDAGAWIVPNHLGISVVVDHEKTYVPILHGVQQSFGALTPSDLEATGKVTVYLWNFDAETHSVKIMRVISRAQSFTANKVIGAAPKRRTGELVGNLQIGNYGTEIPVTVQYEFNDTRGKVDLTLPRRTYQDLKKYFGPGGKPPYPWYIREDRLIPR